MKCFYHNYREAVGLWQGVYALCKECLESNQEKLVEHQKKLEKEKKLREEEEKLKKRKEKSRKKLKEGISFGIFGLFVLGLGFWLKDICGNRGVVLGPASVWAIYCWVPLILTLLSRKKRQKKERSKENKEKHEEHKG